MGPTVEYFRSRGRSWRQIIESASRPGGQDLGIKMASCVIGEEYNEQILAALKVFLKEEGTIIMNRLHGVGGSQEVTEIELKRLGNDLKLEVETFIGITLIGETEAIYEAVDRLNELGAGINTAALSME